METINQITIEELENLIEQKIIEILGDPDTNLELREDFILLNPTIHQGVAIYGYPGKKSALEIAGLPRSTHVIPITIQTILYDIFITTSRNVLPKDLMFIVYRYKLILINRLLYQ